MGPLLNSSPRQDITEKEAAFPVCVVKHLFSRTIVLEFSVRNTVADNLLKNVSVEVGLKTSMKPD